MIKNKLIIIIFYMFLFLNSLMGNAQTITIHNRGGEKLALPISEIDSITFSDFNTISSTDWQKTTKMEYRYGDRSVPPVYHRSYTIAITDSSKVITIDSYGDILLTRQYPNNSTNFQDFKEKLSQKGISKHEKTYDNAGCTGGTSEYIRLYKENEKFFDGYVYHCQGDAGDLYLPDGTSDLFRNQIPEDVNSLIESTRTQ